MNDHDLAPDCPRDHPRRAYKLTRVVSAGSMGTVYEGVQLRLNRRVAVKIMVPELTDNLEALARFRREVKVTSQLAHPHVVQLLDFGTTAVGPAVPGDGVSGRGGPGAAAAAGAQCRCDSVLEIVRQVASALAAIHAKGFVHRDLKPAQHVSAADRGAADFVKVVDFGISKVRTSDSRLTKQATMVGTPRVHVARAGRGPGGRRRPPQRSVGAGLHGLAHAERERALRRRTHEPAAGRHPAGRAALLDG